MSTFLESAGEQAALAWLEAIGCRVAPGPYILQLKPGPVRT